MDPTLKDRIKALLAQTLLLPQAPTELTDDQTLFGPGSLGLDSVDALQLVVMLDKHFGLKISDAGVARDVLQSVGSIVAAIERHQAPGSAS